MLPATRITQASSVFARLANKLRKPLAEKDENITATKEFTGACFLHVLTLQSTLSTKADAKPANVTTPAVTTLTGPNLGAMNTSLSAATRDNTTTAELSVASTKGHRKRKAEEEENEEPVPKRSRILHKSSVESVEQNERQGTENPAPKKFETLIRRTTNPTQPERLKTSVELKGMTCHCLILKKQGSFRKLTLDKVDDGYMKPVTQRRKSGSRPRGLLNHGGACFHQRICPGFS
jgi:hypothetical protein